MADAASAEVPEAPSAHKSQILLQSREPDAAAREWLILLHARPAAWSRNPGTQADDNDFLFAPRLGWTPQSELQAFLQALRNSAGWKAPVSALNGHPACRFPLRAEWVRRNIKSAPVMPAPADCPALQEWLGQLQGDQLTLVFAASYLNNPSSMFGHTLLRLDRSGEVPVLLSPTISYAADAAAHEGELSFAYKGIFGGYPGITTVEPYYRKIRAYSAMEHRDIWEYSLNLDPAEVRRLLLHTWEILDIRFDYYFFDENCAWRLLALMEAARPTLGLIEALPFQRVIPAETVKVVVAAGLVADVRYRPSVSSYAAWKLDRLSADEAEIVEQWLARSSADLGRIRARPRASQQRILEAAYEWLRYRTEVQTEREAVATRRLSVALLQALARLGQNPVQEMPAPQSRPDQGHPALRLGLQAGRAGERTQLALQWRPAYHDFLDPPAGYLRGALLQFLNTELRWAEAGKGLFLQELELIEILSLSPRDRWFSPISWQTAVGARRFEVSDHPVLSPFVEGFAGWSMLEGGWLASLGLQAATAVHDHLPKGVRLELGPRFDLGWSDSRLRVALTTRYRADLLDSRLPVLATQLETSYSVHKQHALVARLDYADWRSGSRLSLLAGWQGWF